MRSIVYYASHSGNTERAATVIADALRAHGPVEVAHVSNGPAAITDEVDLVVVGGPTEGHGMVPEMVEFLACHPKQQRLRDNHRGPRKSHCHRRPRIARQKHFNVAARTAELHPLIESRGHFGRRGIAVAFEPPEPRVAVADAPD